VQAIAYLAGLLAGALAAAGDYGALEDLFGPPDVAIVAGNGGLTVCANSHGRVTGCRWPSPSYHDQLAYRTQSRALPLLGVAPEDGLMWGVRIAGETRWLTGPPWVARQRYAHPVAPVVETASQWPESDLRVTQTLFVHPTQDLIVAQAAVRGAVEAPALYWYANFAPCTRLMPEFPVSDWFLDQANDFAVFAHGTPTTVYHFRPRQPGADTWARAERQAAAGTLGHDVAAFGEGVWIGYTSADAILEFQCGHEGARSSAFRQAEAGQLGGDVSAVGQCNGALRLAPAQDEDAYRATVYIAFGPDRAAVDAELAYARETGYTELARQSGAYWQGWTKAARVPETADEALQAGCRRLLVTVAQAMDRSTCAVVRCPTTQPPLALDWVRHGFWTILALDMAGYPGLAGVHAQFYCENVRRAGDRGKPLGSLPAATYTNHVEALPHAILESEAAAWMLASLWRHAQFLDANRRAGYLAEAWEAVALAAEFLVGWGDARTGAPLDSFHADLGRDARSVRLLLATFIGVDSAVRIAEIVGRDVPSGWHDRKRELNVLILIHCVEDGRWRLDQPIPFGLEEIAATIVPDPPLADADRLATLERLEGPEAARALCNLALAWRDRPDKLAELRPILETVLANAVSSDGENGQFDGHTPIFPDALAAAQAYIAAMTIHGQGPE